jgi:response regulator RpfG family c-di-GMP phosphodiesterase
MSERQKAEQTLFRQKLELLVLTQDETVLSHVREVISEHKLTFRYFHEGNIDLPQEAAETKKPAVILVSQKENENLQTFSISVDNLLKDFPKSSIITILKDSSLSEDLKGTENPNVYPLSLHEFLNTAKFETVILTKSRSQFFTILPTDLFPMTSIDFTAYVQLSLNQRYLAVLFKRLVLSEERLQRISRAKGLLIPITESQGYHNYISSYYDMSGASLKKRSRSLFYTLSANWMILFDYLALDYKTLPEAQIEDTFAKIQTTIKEIIELLTTDEDLWDTFREASSNPVFKMWRSLWIAIYSALIAIKSGEGNPEEALLAGLFSDIGLISLKAELLEKYLTSGLKDLTAEEKVLIEKYPMESLNRCLQKKLPISENVKSIIATSNERFDGTGFPNQVPADKIPNEAYLIRFAMLIDLASRTSMVELGVGFRFTREKLWEAQKQNAGNFAPEFLEKIANALL